MDAVLVMYRGLRRERRIRGMEDGVKRGKGEVPAMVELEEVGGGILRSEKV